MKEKMVVGVGCLDLSIENFASVHVHCLSWLILSIVKVELGNKTQWWKNLISDLCHGYTSVLKLGDRLHDLFLFCSVPVMKLCWTVYWVSQLLRLIWKEKKSLYSSDWSDNCTWFYVYQWIVFRLQFNVNEILIGKQTKDRRVNDW